MEGWWAVSYVVLWALVLGLCVLVVALARQIGALHLRLGPRGALEVDDEGPPLGEAVEPVEVATVEGMPLAVGGPGPPRLVLFVSPSCPVCEQVLPAIGALTGEGSLSPYVLVDADARETERLRAARRLRAPVAAAPEVAVAWEVPGTPYAVVLDDEGVVRAKGTVNNLEQVEGLARTARRRSADALEAQAA